MMSRNRVPSKRDRRRRRAAAAVFLGLGILAASTALAADSGRRADEVARLDTLFQKFMADNHVPGLVYGVVYDGKPLRIHAFGIRDVKNHAPVKEDTAFRIASMSKQFTALATLRDRKSTRLNSSHIL